MTTPPVDYAKMEAGREMDALVAERLMGMRAWKETRGEYTLCVVQRSGDRQPWESTQRQYQKPELYAPIGAVEAVKMGFFGTGFPKFSTDIAAAWQVVERMRSDGFDFRLEIAGAFVSASFDNSGAPPSFGRANLCAFVPLAICLAALAALEPAP